VFGSSFLDLYDIDGEPIFFLPRCRFFMFFFFHHSAHGGVYSFSCFFLCRELFGGFFFFLFWVFPVLRYLPGRNTPFDSSFRPHGSFPGPARLSGPPRAGDWYLALNVRFLKVSLQRECPPFLLMFLCGALFLSAQICVLSTFPSLWTLSSMFWTSPVTERGHSFTAELCFVWIDNHLFSPR